MGVDRISAKLEEPAEQSKSYPGIWARAALLRLETGVRGRPGAILPKARKPLRQVTWPKTAIQNLPRCGRPFLCG